MNASNIGLILILVFTGLATGCTDKSEPGGAIPPSAPGTTTEAPSSAETPDQSPALEGMFSYVADAPVFRDCSTGEVVSVAMAGPYLELESAYLNSGISPGSELKVALHGRYLERPGMEDNSNEIMLVIDSFDGISEITDCLPAVGLTDHSTAPGTAEPDDLAKNESVANSMAEAELKNTFWKLVELSGDAVPVPAGAQEVHMVLSAEDTRVNGYAGCNRFFGQYVLDGEKLGFSAIGSTMMACPEGMDIEQAFLQALGETDRMELNGLVLTLYSQDRRLARFEAVYLP